MTLSDYSEFSASHFQKNFKNILKKFRGAEKDLRVLLETIAANKENTRQTEQVSGLGEKFSKFKVYKTRMHVREVRSYLARLIWYVDEERKTIVLLDLYLKNERTNHDVEAIARGLSEYYHSEG